jgi:hypothetical protein
MSKYKYSQILRFTLNFEYLLSLGNGFKIEIKIRNTTKLIVDNSTRQVHILQHISTSTHQSLLN